MNSDYKIISTTQAVPGWWLMYEDEEGKRYYHPVAAWAKCSTKLHDGSENIHDEWLYPMTPDARHVLHVPVLEGSYLLYLPDTIFSPVIMNAPTYYEMKGKK